jgi:adenylosuccinate synthase
MIGDVPRLLYEANKRGENLLFEGAQGTLLDIDHGTYPFVTSSNCTAGGAPPVPAWARPPCTTCWASPRPTPRVSVPARSRPSCSTTSASGSPRRARVRRHHRPRPRRCGWFDAAALKRSIQINGLTGMCVTKLDVLDGMDTIRICTGYKLGGEVCDILPVGSECWPTASRSTKTIPAGRTAPSA